MEFKVQGLDFETIIKLSDNAINVLVEISENLKRIAEILSLIQQKQAGEF